jgi:1,4-alpha-glucan branching enzyme
MSDLLIERVARTLRAPVPVSRDFDRQLTERLTGAPRARERRRLAFGAGVALAALLAFLAVRLDPVAPAGVRQVELVIDLPTADSVTVVGDFNDWDRTRTRLARVARSNQWRTTLNLGEGVYRYAFLVDGNEWFPDPGRPSAADPDFGGQVSVLAID